jgi:serine/threonine protein kinase
VTRAADLRGLGLPSEIAGYRLVRYIGQGGTAAVYLAQNEHLHRQVALKVLAPELARDVSMRTRTIRKSRAAAAVNHPHIIPVYEADETSGIPYLAERYVRGGDVRSLLNRPGPLSVSYAWHIIAQIASALDAAHAHGLIHCDVKPANILLDASEPAGGDVPPRIDDREFDRAYLTDFGMNRAFLAGQVGATGELTGTLNYAAPEQFAEYEVDGRADLYSLACTGFELLCGAPPFGQDEGLTLMYAQIYAPPPAATAKRADLPVAVDPVLATALAKNPAERYPSCTQFAEELGAALGLRSGQAVLGMERVKPADPVAALGSLERDAMGEPDDPGPKRSARRSYALKPVLAVAAVVAVVAAVMTGVALSKRAAHGSPSVSPTAASSPTASAPPASPSRVPSSSGPLLASEQAAALGALLTSSSAARTALHRAVNEINTCTNLSGAMGQLQDVVTQRSNEYGRASALPMAALPDGAVLKSRLVAALSRSLTADRDYLTWAQQKLAGGCTPSGQSSAYNAAFSASQQADAAKQAFVQVWNPVAAQYGIAPNSPRDI